MLFFSLYMYVKSHKIVNIATHQQGKYARSIVSFEVLPIIVLISVLYIEVYIFCCQKEEREINWILDIGHSTFKCPMSIIEYQASFKFPQKKTMYIHASSLQTCHNWW